MFCKVARIVSLSVLLIFPQSISAQGIFDSFGFPTAVTATGHTEVIGSVYVVLRAGITMADTLVIDVSPFRVTNTNAADIRVLVGGAVTVGPTAIESAEGRVLVPINSGATAATVRVEGIRVSIPGTNASTINARLSWASGMNYFSPSNPVPLVNEVKSGLIAEPMTDRFAIFGNVAHDSNATIVLGEGYRTAFLNSTQYGQDTPTRIRIRVSDFPGGLRMHFPATVNARETAATLTTVEGTTIELPRPDGSFETTYNFSSAANSGETVESFAIPFTVSVVGEVERLQPTIEVSLAPIGAAEPSTTAPATNVPRFAEENLRVLDGTSHIITKTLYWSGIDRSRTNRLSISNPSSNAANIVLTAFDSTGQVVGGSVRQGLPANQSLNHVLTDVFGAAPLIATIRVESTKNEVVALGTTTAPGIAESVGLVDRGYPEFALPAIGDQVRLHLFNPGAETISGTLSLRSHTGTVMGTADLELQGFASISKTLQELFGATVDGYIVGAFSRSVIAFAGSGGATTLNLIAADASGGIGTLYIPFFASGSGYETELYLINRSGQAVTANAQIVNSNGAPIGSLRTISFGPTAQFVATVGQLFDVQELASGYIRIDLPGRPNPFFPVYPHFAGYVRVHYGQNASTAYPMVIYGHSEAAILNSGTNASSYQGIALVNPTSSPIEVALQALSPSGGALATANITLQTGQISAKLTTEYFSMPIPEGSVIRVSTPSMVIVTAITGGVLGEMLRAIPALR